MDKREGVEVQLGWSVVHGKGVVVVDDGVVLVGGVCGDGMGRGMVQEEVGENKGIGGQGRGRK